MIQMEHEFIGEKYAKKIQRDEYEDEEDDHVQIAKELNDRKFEKLRTPDGKKNKIIITVINNGFGLKIKELNQLYQLVIYQKTEK